MTQSLVIARALFPVATGGVAVAGRDNLLTPDPKEVAGHTTAAEIYFDMGASVTIDTAFLGFLGGPGGTTATLKTATSLAGAGAVDVATLTVAPTTERRRHGFAKLGSPVTSRYFGIAIGPIGSAFTVGIFALAKAIQPVWGHDWGSGRFIDDRSEVEGLRGGGFGIERGARVPGWEFTVSELDDTELASLWDLVQEVGKSAPVVVAEDPSLTGVALNRALHYGLFDRPEAYTRETPGQNRWSFRVLGWV